MTYALSVEMLDLDGAERIQDAWRDLISRALEPNVFHEPAFVLAAARHLPRSSRLSFLTIWKANVPGRAELVGLCALQRSRLPGGATAAAWLHPQATAAFPLLDRDTAATALAAMLAALRKPPHRAAAMLLSGVPIEGPTAALLRRLGVPFATLDERTRAILLQDREPAGLGGKARKELRRQGKRLAEHGAITVSSASSPQEVAEALTGFMALEAQGWKGKRGTALGRRPGTLAFARAALAGLSLSGQCRIDTLAVGGQPAAMGVFLRSGDRGYFWKTAYDETLARFSPGLQLVLQASALQRGEPGLALTDSCAVPGHSMIDRIWSDRMIVVDVLISTGSRPTLTFQLACTIERQRRRLIRGLKSARNAVPALRPN